MLTTQLLRARVRGAHVQAQYVDPAAPSMRALAEEVLTCHHEAVEHRRTRGELEQAIADLASERRDHKVARGLAKLASDRTEFASETAHDPVAFRREVFLAARRVGPLSLDPNPLGRPLADDVLEQVAEAHGLTLDQARHTLYADLRESHQVLHCKVPDVDWLLHRYNVALAQAILFQAESIRLELHQPSAPRMRQLLRWITFHQLIASSERQGERLIITLDGPQSLFRQSTRYGTQLARFFPAVLLQEGPWTLEATVRWTRAKHRKTFTVSPEDGLVSHYADHGAYRTEAQRHFEARFDALDTPWVRHDGSELIALGPKRVVFPDYTFQHGTRQVHLHWVGFWRRETLSAYLDCVQRYAPDNLLLAVSTRLAGSKDPLDLGKVGILYKGVLSPKKVLEAIERAK